MAGHTWTAAGSARPSNRVRNARHNSKIGALENRSNPSGPAPAIRCTNPNSQLSPILSKFITRSRSLIVSGATVAMFIFNQISLLTVRAATNGVRP
jgi:hypothetical protein